MYTLLAVAVATAQPTTPAVPTISAETVLLPGANVDNWHRPAPIAGRVVLATDDRTEGQVYLDRLPAEERQILMTEGVILVQQEDPDSPSAGSNEDAAVRGYIRAMVIFDQPISRATELMFQPERLADFLEELDDAETIARQDGVGELTKFTIEFLWIDIEFHIQHWFFPDLNRYEWYLDNVHFENDIDGNKGYWQMYQLDDRRTIGEYGVQVDTGIPLPRKWIERIQRRKIPDAMNQFRRFIDSGGQYNKDD